MQFRSVVLPTTFHATKSVQINEALKFLADSPSEPTHSIWLVYPINASDLLVICSQLHCAANYFDVHSPNINEYEND